MSSDRQAVADAMAPGVNGPPPVILHNGASRRPLLVVCDHGGNAIPPEYNGLGLSAADLARHIAWDIGAADLAAALADRHDACALIAPYSRLLIDINRQLDDPTSIPVVSDHTIIEGNRAIDGDERQRRIERFFSPYHRAIGDRLALIEGGGAVPILLSVHSFTPSMGGVDRPWHAGVLWDSDGRIALPLLAALRAEPGLAVGDNEPYSGRWHYGYTIRHHALARGFPNVLIEVRQDLIAAPEGVSAWAERLARCLAPILSGLEAPR